MEGAKGEEGRRVGQKRSSQSGGYIQANDKNLMTSSRQAPDTTLTNILIFIHVYLPVLEEVAAAINRKEIMNKGRKELVLVTLMCQNYCCINIRWDKKRKSMDEVEP